MTEGTEKAITTEDLDGGGKAPPVFFPWSFLDKDEQPQFAIRLSSEVADRIFSRAKRLFVYPTTIHKLSKQSFYVMVDENIVGAVQLGHGFSIDKSEFALTAPLHQEAEWTEGMKAYRIEEAGMFDKSIPVYASDLDDADTIFEVEKMSGVVDATVWKSVLEERIIAAAVLVPGRTDLHDEIYDEETVRAAAYYFMEHYLQDEDHGIDVMHDGEIVPDSIRVLQSFVLDDDKTYTVEVPALADDHEAKKTSEISFPKGTWIMYARVISDTLWDKVKNGELKSWSIAGLARVRELRKLLMAA